MLDTVCLYVEFLSRTLTPASIRNYLSGVKLLHLFTGADYPFTKEFILPSLYVVSLAMPCTPRAGPHQSPLPFYFAFPVFLHLKVIHIR